MEIVNTGTIDFLDTQVMTREEALSHEINALLLAREGTIPGSRNFGLKQDYLSAPGSAITLNVLGMELQEKLDIYFDGVDVKSITGTTDTDGHFRANVSVEDSRRSTTASAERSL